MNTTLAKTLKVALLSCVVALGVARTADAAYVVINADPVYGKLLPGVSWRAVGSLYVNDSTPTSCLPTALGFNQPPGIAINPFPVILGLAGSKCSDSGIVGVQLQFYETTTFEILQTGDVDDFTADKFWPDFTRNRLDAELISFTLRDGELEALTTTLSRPVYFSGVGGGDYCFAVELSSASARVESTNYDKTKKKCSTTLNKRAADDPRPEATFEFDGAFTPGGGAEAARLAATFSELPPNPQDVPEPASLALTLAALAAALGAGSLARRSRA